MTFILNKYDCETNQKYDPPITKPENESLPVLQWLAW